MIASEILQAMYDGQLLVFAHRGAKAYAPMNTLPAFKLAAEQGAHGIELDVQRSKDGHPVIVHDYSVEATSDGTGRATEMSLAELKTLDAGRWFDVAFTGTRIATLDEVFEAVGQKLYINVEIKSQLAETDGVEQVVADCIVRHQMHGRVILSSFNPLTLKRFRAILPDIPLGYLFFAEEQLQQQRNLITATDYEARHPFYEIISEGEIKQAETNGHFVNAWTVNDAEQAQRLQVMGVHGIITDYPDVILDALA